MAGLRVLFKARYLPLLDDVVEEAVLTPDGRFRASPPYREKMTRFLRDRTPIELTFDFETQVAMASGRVADQLYIDRCISFLFRKGNAFPPDTHCQIPRDEPTRFCWWQSDGWRDAGWPHPSDTRWWWETKQKARPERYWPELLV